MGWWSIVKDIAEDVPWDQVVGAVASFLDDGGDPGSVTETQTSQPAPHTPESQWIMDYVNSMIQGTDGGLGLQGMLQENLDYSQLTDKQAFQSGADISGRYQTQTKGMLDNWMKEIIPMITQGKYDRSLNQALRKQNIGDQNIQRQLGNRTPVNLSFGGGQFQTPFTTGTMRNAQDQALQLGRYGIDLTEQNMRSRNQSGDFLDSILGNQRERAGSQRGDALALANAWSQSQQRNQPNAANLQALDILSGLDQRNQDRLAGLATQTQTTTTDAGGQSVFDMLGDVRTGADQGGEFWEWFKGIFNSGDGNLA